MEFETKDEHIVYARGYREAPVNGEFLCVKGRSGWDFVTSPERLTQPLVRKDLAYELGLTAEPWQLPNTTPLKAQGRDYFVPVSWETGAWTSWPPAWRARSPSTGRTPWPG